MKMTQWNVSVSKLSNRGLGVIFLLITFETRQDSSWACVIDIVLVVIKRPHGPFFHIRFWTYCAPRGSRIRPRYINESAICNNVFFSSQILYAKRCSLAGYTNLFRIRTERRGKENIHINGHFTNQLEGTTMEWGNVRRKWKSMAHIWKENEIRKYMQAMEFYGGSVDLGLSRVNCPKTLFEFQFTWMMVLGKQ